MLFLGEPGSERAAAKLMGKTWSYSCASPWPSTWVSICPGKASHPSFPSSSSAGSSKGFSSPKGTGKPQLSSSREDPRVLTYPKATHLPSRALSNQGEVCPHHPSFCVGQAPALASTTLWLSSWHLMGTLSFTSQPGHKRVPPPAPQGGELQQSYW